MDGMGNNEQEDIKRKRMEKIIEIKKAQDNGVLGCVYKRTSGTNHSITNLSITYIVEMGEFKRYSKKNDYKTIKGWFSLANDPQDFAKDFFDLSTRYTKRDTEILKDWKVGKLIFVPCKNNDVTVTTFNSSNDTTYMALDAGADTQWKDLEGLKIGKEEKFPMDDANKAVENVVQPILDELSEIQNAQKDEQKKMSEDIDLAWEIKEKIKSNRQIVFTGAPGTGKTFCIRKAVKELTGSDKERFDFVQFHSSYDYTDFVEGLRPVPGEQGENIFVRLDGTFKKFCRKIVEDNLTRVVDIMNEGESEQDKKAEISIENLYDTMVSSDSSDSSKAKRDKIRAKIKEKEYYFIIDEINRADLSKVFGELMFGLDEDYRGVENRFHTQYANLDTYMEDEKEDGEKGKTDCFKEGFFIPENVTIIGSMNDIDRSVESFDFALRRRFVWEDVKANKVMLKSLEAMRDDNLSEVQRKIVERIKEMNRCIANAEFGLTEAYHIGPAYFKEFAKCEDKDIARTLTNIFDHKIEPTLREYTRGRKENVVKKWIEGCRDALLPQEQENAAEGNNASGDGEQNG